MFSTQSRATPCSSDRVLSSLNYTPDRNSIAICIRRFFSVNNIISDKFDISLRSLSFIMFMLTGCFAVDIRYPRRSDRISVSICNSIFLLILLIAVDLGKRDFQSDG